jgi:hypothetical protein
VEHAADMVTRAIAFARARRIRKLLVDASKLTGFELPHIGKLYFFIHDWARVAEGGVRVAFVTRPELIEQQGFGRTDSICNVDVELIRHILGFQAGRHSYLQAGLRRRIAHAVEIYFHRQRHQFNFAVAFRLTLL